MSNSRRLKSERKSSGNLHRVERRRWKFAEVNNAKGVRLVCEGGLPRTQISRDSDRAKFLIATGWSEWRPMLV